MRYRMSFVTSLAALILLAAVSGQAHAQTFTTLCSFSPGNGNSEGSLVLSGSTLYGTTSSAQAGANGTIFSVNTDGSGFQTLFSFGGTNGDWPQGGLLLSGSTLFGTTSYGGTYSYGGDAGDGTIFSIATNGSGFKSLFSFTGEGQPLPNGSLTLSGSTLYGTTEYGGAGQTGTIFSINANGSGFQNLLAFSGTNGENPQFSSLTLAGSTMYGQTGGEEPATRASFSESTQAAAAFRICSHSAAQTAVIPKGI